MNKEQQQIVDKVYEEYERLCQSQELIDYDDKETFIKSIKNYSMVAKRWGLKIEERELSEEERYDLYEEKYMFTETIEERGIDYKYKIPTKLITVTYEGKTIESYDRNR